MAQPRKSFTTSKGTELPLLNLKGKEYLQVMHRIQWFREEHPTGILKTSMLAMNGEGEKEYAVFKTEVFINGNLIASAHKKETRGGFDDFIEKAETGSVGRALALCGYGTQFASDELYEGDRLADSPVPVVEKIVTAITPAATGANAAVGSAGNPAAANGTGGRASFRKPPTATVSTGVVKQTSTSDDI